MTTFLESAKKAGLNGKPGKQAIKGTYRKQISTGENSGFTGSVDLDHHFSNAEPNANRWDYGVGFKHGDGEFVIWIEPHPAGSSKEVDIILKKLEWLKSKLRLRGYEGLSELTNMAEGKGEIPYRWLYEGKTSFRSGGKEAKRLAQKGMKLPEKYINIG